MRIILLFLILLPSFFGYSQIISEPFTSGSQPAGWNQTSVTFTTSAGGYANFTSSTATLTSPTFNAASFCSVLVTFDVAKFGTGGDGPISVEYSLDGGSTWTFAGDSPTPTGSSYLSASISIPVVSANMQIRLNRGSSPSQKRFRNLVVAGVGSCGSTNTINAGTISGAPFNVNCSGITDSGSIDYTSTGTFTGGNTFTVELSDASGSFTSPTIIGTTVSTVGSGTLNLIIPAGTPTGSGYIIRIIASNPSTVSTNSVAFTITQLGSCAVVSPYITSLIYNGCNVSGCDEGESEIVFANTADYSLTVSSANININYPSSPNYDLIGTVVNNTATTANMNSNAGCSGLFIDGFGLTLPPNSSFLMVPSNICLSALDWTSLCGSGPIYVIYGQSGLNGDTWHTGGNFGNSSGPKNFSVDFTTSGGAFTTAYSYNPPSGGNDGDYATFAPGGGTANTQGNFPNCALTPVALSSELIEFTGELLNQQALLKWKTASERENAEFIIHHSTNGINWKTIGTAVGNGTTNSESSYSMTHTEPKIGLNYYQLNAKDYNGKLSKLGIVAIELTGNFAFYNAIKNQLEFNSERSVALIAMDGKIISEERNIEQLSVVTKGMFILQDLISGEKQRVIIY